MRNIFESMSNSTPVDKSTFGCSNCDPRGGGRPNAPSGLLLLLLLLEAVEMDASGGRTLEGTVIDDAATEGCCRITPDAAVAVEPSASPAGEGDT